MGYVDGTLDPRSYAGWHTQRGLLGTYQVDKRMKEQAPKLKTPRPAVAPPTFKLAYGAPAKDAQAGGETATKADKLDGAQTGTDGKTS